MGYRDLLYKRYHSQHTSRHTGLDAHTLQLTEALHFQREWGVLLMELNREARLLDIGCGNGSLIMALHQLGFRHVQGIDISEEQIQIARQSGLVETEVADATTYLNDKFGLFDAVFCMDLVEHLTKSELVELLLLIRKALRPNGRLYLRTPNMDSPWPHLFASGDFTHETLLNANSIRQLLGSTGFQEVHLFPSLMRVRPWWKEILRNLTYQILSLRWRLELFATARSSQGIVLSPNLLVRALAPTQV
jgi:2-polyprenyl-3-methyl-5-hydroxy-6-metoxy-1,4-benzoquinol methylase